MNRFQGDVSAPLDSDALVEAVARATAGAHDETAGRGLSPALDAYDAGSCAVYYWDSIAQAAIAAARPIIEAEVLERVYDKARGTNADLCKTPGAAYRLMLDAIRSLKGGTVTNQETT